MPLQFTNIAGEVITESQINARKAIAHQEAARKKKTVEVKSFHKGWKVVGIPPGELEEARAANQRVQDMATRAGGREVKAFDESNWLQNHRGKAVRSKPYETQASAAECAALATKTGWLRVRIDEVKRKVKDTDEIAPF